MTEAGNGGFHCGEKNNDSVLSRREDALTRDGFQHGENDGFHHGGKNGDYPVLSRKGDEWMNDDSALDRGAGHRHCKAEGVRWSGDSVPSPKEHVPMIDDLGLSRMMNDDSVLARPARWALGETVADH